jgi:hypothetical protein
MALLTRAGAALLLAACGLGGGPEGGGGGGENLPFSGIGPYGKVTDFVLATPLDEPFLLVDVTADLLDPAPLPRGGATRLLYTRAAAGRAEIWRADVLSLAVEPVDAQPVLVPDQPWEEERVAAPAPVEAGELLVVYYQAGDGVVARAESRDGGSSFTKTGPVLDDAAQPAAVLVGGVTFLYHERPSRPGIFLAWSSDGSNFQREPDPVLAASGGERYDASFVGEPAAVGGVTPAGQVRVALFFTARGRTGLAAVGYAASFDGVRFTRAAEPVLDPPPPGERGPGPLIGPTSGVLFFVQDRSGRAAIAVATAP